MALSFAALSSATQTARTPRVGTLSPKAATTTNPEPPQAATHNEPRITLTTTNPKPPQAATHNEPRITLTATHNEPRAAEGGHAPRITLTTTSRRRRPRITLTNHAHGHAKRT